MTAFLGEAASLILGGFDRDLQVDTVSLRPA